MKRQLIITLNIMILFLIISCNNYVEDQIQILTDVEWVSILNNTPGSKYIYKEYNNTELKDTIAWVYYNCSHLGYDIQKSKIHYVYNRKNKLITNKLDTISNFRFIIDTIGFKYDYVIYSEPFFVTDEIVCVSISKKEVKENVFSHRVFFLKKQNDLYKIIEFYDVRKDRFYEQIPLK